jgi:hypothetical protein
MSFCVCSGMVAVMALHRHPCNLPRPLQPILCHPGTVQPAFPVLLTKHCGRSTHTCCSGCLFWHPALPGAAYVVASSRDKVKGTCTSCVSHLVVMPPESVLLVYGSKGALLMAFQLSSPSICNQQPHAHISSEGC